MIDTAVYIIQLILLFCLTKERKVQYFLFSMAAVSLINIAQFGNENYYLRCTMYDSLQIIVALAFLCRAKAILISCICLLSVWMNLHEHFSHYQTFLYGYRDIIQFWLAELIVVVAIWKTKWRKINVFTRRKNVKTG